MLVGLLGSGNIARAFALGWGDPVLCSDPLADRAKALADEVGGEAVASNEELAERADIVLLCHKPAQLEDVAAPIARLPAAVASVLVTRSVADLQAAYPDRPVFRFLPTTAVEVARGVIGYAPAPDVDGTELEGRVLEHFGRLGTIVRLPENLIETAGAAAYVGPAYLSLVAEAMADAAVRHGLPPQLADDLVAESLVGSAELLRARGMDTRGVRRQVTSPGGVTVRGVAHLEDAGVRSAFSRAMDAVLGRDRP